MSGLTFVALFVVGGALTGLLLRMLSAPTGRIR